MGHPCEPAGRAVVLPWDNNPTHYPKPITGKLRWDWGGGGQRDGTGEFEFTETGFTVHYSRTDEVDVPGISGPDPHPMAHDSAGLGAVVPP